MHTRKIDSKNSFYLVMRLCVDQRVNRKMKKETIEFDQVLQLQPAIRNYILITFENHHQPRMDSALSAVIVVVDVVFERR